MSSINGVGNIYMWRAACQRMKLDPYLKPYTKISSKWIKDLNLRPETMKFLEENTGGKLLNKSLGKDFLNLTPKAKRNESTTINELHQASKKLTCYCTVKATTNKMKR